MQSQTVPPIFSIANVCPIWAEVTIGAADPCAPSCLPPVQAHGPGPGWTRWVQSPASVHSPTVGGILTAECCGGPGPVGSLEQCATSAHAHSRATSTHGHGQRISGRPPAEPSNRCGGRTTLTYKCTPPHALYRQPSSSTPLCRKRGFHSNDPVRPETKKWGGEK